MIVFLISLGKSAAVIEFDKCDGVQAVSDIDVNYKSIYSHCNCTITTRFTGILYFTSENCSTDIFILNHTDKIRVPCESKGTRIGLESNVVEGDKLYTFSTEINKSLTESTIFSQKTLIFARMYEYLLSIY